MPLRADRRQLRDLLFASVLLTLAVGPSPAASAHAQVLDAAPAPGEVLDAPPAEVALLFNEPVQPAGDGIVVEGPGGRVDRGDVAHGTGPDVLRVSLVPDLSPGTYTVSWSVVSADTHVVDGAHTFEIAGTATPPGATPPEGATPKQQAGGGPGQANAEGAGEPPFDAADLDPEGTEEAAVGTEADGVAWGLIAVLASAGAVSAAGGAWAIGRRGRAHGSDRPRRSRPTDAAAD